jgi:cytochrome b
MSLSETKIQTVVWTAFVRTTHGLVALFVFVNFFNDTGSLHRLIGYFCLALVFARIGYGLWLSKVASSKFYMPKIANIKLHIHEIRTQIFASHIGHNPLGQLAVYLIWALIAALALTGWLSRTDTFWGEDWPVDLHVIFSNALQGLVILHIAAIVLMSKLQKKNLLKQMISGSSSEAAR